MTYPVLPRFIPIREHEKNGDSEDSVDRYYVTPVGRYRSVTTILDKTFDKSGLYENNEAIGEERAALRLKLATSRGNRVHHNIEQYLEKGTVPPFSYFHTPYWKSAYRHIRTIKHTIFNEGAVWHPLGWGGTIDHVGIYHDSTTNEIEMSDWKSADSWNDDAHYIKVKLYKYYLQLAAYVKAFNYVYSAYSVRIRKARLCVFLPDRYPKVFHLNEDQLEQYALHFQARLERLTRY